MNRTLSNSPAVESIRPQPHLAARSLRDQSFTPYELEQHAQNYSPISLKEMDRVALLNRMDTKFVLTHAQLLDTLAAVQMHYRILTVENQRLNHYRTLYFDTADFDLYNLHVNGRADRYKVRSREYIDTGLSFLEVKHKTPKERTIKSRLMTAHPVLSMDLAAEQWLDGVYPYNSHLLEPKLWNTFTRITLVRYSGCERVTLDSGLTFHADGQSRSLQGLAIAEVKMDADSCASPFLAQMRSQRIFPKGFSKYVFGVSLLFGQVKKNAMKPKMRWVERLTEGVFHD